MHSHMFLSLFPVFFFPLSEKTALFSLFFLDQVSSFQSESVALAHTLPHIHQQPHQLQRMRQQAPRKKTVLGRGAALRQQHMSRKEGTLPGPCTAAHLALSHSRNGHMRTPQHTIRHTKHRSKEYKVKKKTQEKQKQEEATILRTAQKSRKLLPLWSWRKAVYSRTRPSTCCPTATKAHQFNKPTGHTFVCLQCQPDVYLCVSIHENREEKKKKTQRGGEQLQISL